VSFWTRPRTGIAPDGFRSPFRPVKNPATGSAATNCCNGSAKAAAGWFTWRSKPTRFAAASRSRSSKLGMDTKSVTARFEAERQALALMDHPSIAKVFDAGATETGRPYFVMELVRGIKITDFCDEKKLSPRARSIVHPGLPGDSARASEGIIIGTSSRRTFSSRSTTAWAVPKIIDFGIAKATSGQLLTDKTIYTAFEQFHRYARLHESRQAVLTSLDIDTRSDILRAGGAALRTADRQDPVRCEGTASRLAWTKCAAPSGKPNRRVPPRV